MFDLFKRKTENKFQIVFSVRYDKYGVSKDEHFTVTQWTYGWLRQWHWRTATHLDCGWGDCHNTVTKFGNQNHAEDYIRDIVQCKPIDEWVNYVVETVE